MSVPLPRVLAAAAVFVLSNFWLVALLLAPRPFAHSAAFPADRNPSMTLRAAALVYAAGSLVCHQQRDRSFREAGVPLPVCARCAGVYLGVPLGCALSVVMLLWRGAPPRTNVVLLRRALIVAASPTLVTVLFEQLGWWIAAGPVRAVAGVPLGFAGGALVAAAIGGLSLEDRTGARTAASSRPGWRRE